MGRYKKNIRLLLNTFRPSSSTQEQEQNNPPGRTGKP